VRRFLKSSKSPESRQLGEILEGSLPCRILVIRWMTTCESPSRTILRWPLSNVACSPLSEPMSSATLFVVSPRKPVNSPTSFPSESLATAPHPAVPGLPLAAPSKLILMKWLCGGVQEEGLVWVGLLIRLTW
jgi:hypothetical protein